MLYHLSDNENCQTQRQVSFNRRVFRKSLTFSFPVNYARNYGYGNGHPKFKKLQPNKKYRVLKAWSTYFKYQLNENWQQKTNSTVLKELMSKNSCLFVDFVSTHKKKKQKWFFVICLTICLCFKIKLNICSQVWKLIEFNSISFLGLYLFYKCFFYGFSNEI